MELIVKACVRCGEDRKFMKDTLRDYTGICGNCWDWKRFPGHVVATDYLG